MRGGEGIRFWIEVVGETPLDAMRKADRLAANLVADWPTDWSIEFTEASLERYAGTGEWCARVRGRAVE